MPVTYACSFEAGSMAYYAQNGWNITGMTIHSGARVHKTPLGVGGNYAVDIDAGSGNGRTLNLGTGNRWVHFAHQPQAPGVPLVNIFTFEIGAAAQFAVRIQISGVVELLRGASVVATSAGAINRGVPHWFAIQLLAADAGGVCEFWSDGVLIVSFSGDTKNQATANWDTLRFTDASTLSDYTFDDLIVTDAATGRVTEQFCQVMSPDSVDSGNLTGVPTAGASRFQNVNEIPTSQSQYNEGAVVNDEDIYGMSDPATPTTVLCVALWLEAARAGAITQVEPIIKSGATTVYATPEVLPTSGYESVLYIAETDPDTAAAWTGGGLNAMKAGARFS